MCGIAGVLDFQGRPVDPCLLERWLAALAHRGPDDRGTWLGECGSLSVGLAHTRLSVIDPSPAGHQPMFDESGQVGIVYNGEVYNFAELRGELAGQGQVFRSASDTEVILRSYWRWGAEFLTRLSGMWALVIIDRRSGTGLLARDRYGIKPLCYAVRDGRLYFASEMAALAAVPGLCAEIDPPSLSTYLKLGYIPHPATIFKHVYMLPPGTLLTFDAAGHARPMPFYRLPAPDGRPTYEDARRQVRETIGQAVRRHLVADVPLGAFLSGGLDSSLLVAHMAEHASGPVRTFSIGYVGQPRYDETAYARLVAERFGTEHQEFKLSFAEVLGEMPAVWDRLGEPFGDASLVPTGILSRYTRSAVTVALSGDGGDELFAGYWRYLGHGFLRSYMKLPRLLRQALLEPLASLLPAGKDSYLSNRVRQFRKLLRTRSDVPLTRHLAWSQIVSPDAARLLFAHAEQADLADVFARAADQRFEPPEVSEPLAELLRADLLVSLPGDMLHKVDLASMGHALEVRVPLLDPAVVHLAMSLPADFKLAGRGGKRVLRDAYRDLLPAPVLSRKKMGFELPIGEFLRNELRDLFGDVVTREAVQRFGCLNWTGVQRLYDEHRSRRGEHADILYALLVLCWWDRRHRTELTPAGTSPPMCR